MSHAALRVDWGPKRFAHGLSAGLVALLLGSACSEKATPAGPADAATTPRDAGVETMTTADMGGPARSDANLSVDAPKDAAGVQGMTAAKFCHEMVDLDTGEPIEIELVVGTTRFKTLGDGCVMPAAQACAALPVGKVTGRVFDRGVEAFRNELTLEAGKEYLFSFRIDEETGEGEIFALPLRPALPCAAAKLTDMPPPAPVPFAPPPAGTMSDVKLCNGLAKPAAAPGVLQVTSEKGLRLSARPGECVPAKGTACSKVAAGEDTLTLLLDGEEIGSADVRFPANGGLVLVPRTVNAEEFLLQRVVVPADLTCAAYEPL
ncbi:MAG TPA: hypothetical protein VGG33_19695 [Polyangia bacterium]